MCVQGRHSVDALTADDATGKSSSNDVLKVRTCNRTTLCKYLDPNLVGATGSPSRAPPSDSTKWANATSKPRSSRTGVYHYLVGEVGPNQAKRYRVVSVELYEGNATDHKRKRCAYIA